METTVIGAKLDINLFKYTKHIYSEVHSIWALFPKYIISYRIAVTL